jgi:tetratricopeptide (TPR) repeat protein
MDTRDAARAESEFDKALRLNPGSADLLSTFAGWASNFGEPEEGVAAADRAIRLNPDTPAWALYNFGYDDNDPFRPYDSPWVFNVGVGVGF